MKRSEKIEYVSLGHEYDEQLLDRFFWFQYFGFLKKMTGKIARIQMETKKINTVNILSSTEHVILL